MAGEMGIVGIIVAIIIVGFGAAFSILMLATTQTVFTNIGTGNAQASTAFTNTIGPIYSTIPMLSLVILALIGGAIIGSLFYYLRGR